MDCQLSKNPILDGFEYTQLLLTLREQIGKVYFETLCWNFFKVNTSPTITHIALKMEK